MVRILIIAALFAYAPTTSAEELANPWAAAVAKGMLTGMALPDTPDPATGKPPVDALAAERAAAMLRLLNQGAKAGAEAGGIAATIKSQP